MRLLQQADLCSLPAQLYLAAPQLVLGCVCILALVTSSAVTMVGLRILRGPVMDGSLMNTMSLLRGSSLPAIIAGGNDEGTGTKRMVHGAAENAQW